MPRSRVSGIHELSERRGLIWPENGCDLAKCGVQRCVDMRLQRKFTVNRRYSFDGIFEVFNVFNRTNYGSWVTNEGNARYGQPTDNNNIAFMPRLVQFGFRTTF